MCPLYLNVVVLYSNTDFGCNIIKPTPSDFVFACVRIFSCFSLQLADGLGGTCWVATTDGLKKDSSVIKKPGNAKFCSLRFGVCPLGSSKYEERMDPFCVGPDPSCPGKMRFILGWRVGDGCHVNEN